MQVTDLLFARAVFIRAVLTGTLFTTPGLLHAETGNAHATATANEATTTGESAEQSRGRQIAIEADKRNSGYVDSEASLSMVLRDNKGRERIRAMRVQSIERPDDGDWSLTVFDNPTDVKGTALLTYSHGLEPDDQWLYLPALKRVKRISSKNKSGPFMGSEIAFEDLSSFELEKYTYRFLREEACDERTCFVSEWTPAYPHSGYSRTEVWHDTEYYRPHKIEFYDRSGAHLKSLALSDYHLYNNQFWRAHTWTVSNHKTGKTTLLTYEAIKLGVGLNERDFDKNSLKSAR